jgi:hypothetical protein
MCYPASEFRVGDQDVRLGRIAGCPFYMGAAQFEYWRHTQLIIDAVPGRGSGFSLEAPLGVRFLTRSRVFTDAEAADLERTDPAMRGAEPIFDPRRSTTCRPNGPSEPTSMRPSTGPCVTLPSTTRMPSGASTASASRAELLDGPLMSNNAADDYAAIAANLKKIKIEKAAELGIAAPIETPIAVESSSASVDDQLGGYDPYPIETHFDVMF